MSYSEEQIRRIRYLLSDEWVEDDPIQTERNLSATLALVESAEELYQFVGNFNLDGGFDEFRKVIDHPLCDKGVALLIYYRLNPSAYYFSIERGKPFLPFQNEPFAFIKEIEARFRDGLFATSLIRVDPYNFKHHSLLKTTTRGSERIPDFMKLPTDGIDVEIIQVI